jgi:hypothetical protein
MSGRFATWAIAAAITPTQLSTTGPVVADGVGTAAWTADAAVRVLDDGSPPSAARAYQPPGPCLLTAVGAGQLLFDCGPDPVYYSFAPTLVDLGSAAARPVAPDAIKRFVNESSANGEFHTSSGVGSRLVRLDAGSSKGGTTAYVEWHTGRLTWRRPLGPRTVESLATPTGRAPLCSPVRVGSHREFDYIDVIRVRDYASLVAPWTVRTHGGRVIVQRCGSRRWSVLARGVRYQPWLTTRFVAWRRARTLYAQSLQSGRRHRWPIAPDSAIAATGSRLFVTTPGLGRPATAWYVEPS